MKTRSALLALSLLLATAASATPAQAPKAERERGRELLRLLIETNTTPRAGTTLAAEKLAGRFLAAGFARDDVMLLGDDPLRRNLVVRLRGKGERKPVLLMAHLDVVEARREDWTLEPFALTERDGWLYGRGTMDIKGGAAGAAATLLRLRAEGRVPRGDYVLLLTAGEEDGVSNGIEWLLAHRPDLLEAAYAINFDGGGPEIRGGRPAVLPVQTAEKVYLSYTLEVRDPGGHSSVPTPDNPIHRLAKGLTGLAAFDFPLRTNSATRGHFARLAALETGAAAADMRAAAVLPQDEAALRRLAARSAYDNAQLRTTCTPTLLEGGHAENALPQLARATVNCRLLPDEDPAQVDRWLAAAVADPRITLRRVAEPMPSPPSPVDDALFRAIGKAAAALWGPMPVAPYMSAGATDSVFLRAAGLPVYVFNGIPYDVDDDRSHGQDERIGAEAFDQSLEFTYRLLEAL